MATRTVTVGSTGGLHARPAALFVAAAAAAPMRVPIRTATRPAVPAASMLSVLALRATFGTEVVLEAEGPGADEALDRLSELVARNLDEEPDEKPERKPLRGIGVSPGSAGGPAHRMVPPPSL